MSTGNCKWVDGWQPPSFLGMQLKIKTVLLGKRA